MSATIYWVPVEKRRFHVPTLAPSTFLRTLEAVFDRVPPCTLGESDLGPLSTLEKAHGEATANPWATLVEAVTKHGHVRITTEY